jgi:hypothetical protein
MLSPLRRGNIVATRAAQNEQQLDRQAQAALAKVKLDHFTAEPSTIEPFTGTKISWEVAVLDESEVPVDLDIDGTPVAPSGTFEVAPKSTTSYRLSARAHNHSKEVGTLIAHLDSTACIAKTDEPTWLIKQVIKGRITTDPAQLYFRSEPIVSIRDDRMFIHLHIAQRLKSNWNLPDPIIDIDASFTLDVIPIPRQGGGGLLGDTTAFQYHFHQLAPANEEVSVAVNVHWWWWLIPGLAFYLIYALSGAADAPRAKATKMIAEITEALNGWFHGSDVNPPKMDKHDAGFYVNPQGEERFWITFCPVPDLILPTVDT